MAREPLTLWDDDPDQGPEADLWFLPPDDAPDPSPLPQADRSALFPAAEWRAAEGALASDRLMAPCAEISNASSKY